MHIEINNQKYPERCEGCFAEDPFSGGCTLLNLIGCDAGIAEYDEEWHTARKEKRKLKWCPICED